MKQEEGEKIRKGIVGEKLSQARHAHVWFNFNTATCQNTLKNTKS